MSYIPKSTYQFFIEFDFHGTFSIPVFTFSVQINPDYASYFSSEDLAQLKVLRVDPSVLKKGEKKETLSLDDLDDDTFGLTDELKEYIESA